MAVKLPNGSTLFISAEIGEAKAVGGISNAAEAVVTATGHGLADGDFVILKSGWGKLNERVFKVSGVAANTFKIGVDTTNTDIYPANSGGGTLQKVARWQQLTQVLNFATSGGEQQFYNFQFLEDEDERQMPTNRSAYGLTFDLGDDESLPGHQAMRKASNGTDAVALRLNLKGGGGVAFYGYATMAETPNLTLNEIMTTSCSFSLNGRPFRFK